MKTFSTNRKILSLLVLALCLSYSCHAQEFEVGIYFNIVHSIKGQNFFDRSKFITIHANQTENEWDGNNFTDDLRDDFLNKYDVYLGRDTGGISWYVNQVKEDSERTGYADPNELKEFGEKARKNFENNGHLHEYETRKSLIIASQLHPFWTGDSQKPTGQGWKFANATATGEYMGRYISEFHGKNGQQIPAWVEIINEPAYESLGGPNDYSNSIEEIAIFHNEAATAIRKQTPNVKIGGYTTAFPNFEMGNFQRWHNRWKLFMDLAGNQMDFWSIHLYDFPSIHNGKKELRSGSNMEATLDMLDHYSLLSFDEAKPIIVSEYGAQMHDYAKEQWSPYRDWLHLKASNAQLMSFLERPNSIASAINFIIVKAEWGYKNGIPYNHRLMRKENEPHSYTGKWVYTDMVKFYKLWQNVKGKRIRTTSKDPDIQIDAYTEGSKAYVILNNLNFEDTRINLNIIDTYNTTIINLNKKHLTLQNNRPILLDEDIDTDTNMLTLGAESTIVLEYTFSKKLILDEESKETKYYATTYLNDIIANQIISFDVNGLELNDFGEAFLRVGMGRDHGKNLQPVINFNGVNIEVPDDWRGYDQADRSSFFGVLEIPVPFDLLQNNNQIEISFPDSGGKVSSLSVQLFNFSEDFPTLSVDSNETDTSIIQIVPNPSNWGFKYTLPFRHQKGKLTLYSIHGQIVHEEPIDKHQNTVFTSHLEQGMYIVNFSLEGNISINEKLLIR